MTPFVFSKMKYDWNDNKCLKTYWDLRVYQKRNSKKIIMKSWLLQHVFKGIIVKQLILQTRKRSPTSVAQFASLRYVSRTVGFALWTVRFFCEQHSSFCKRYGSFLLNIDFRVYKSLSVDNFLCYVGGIQVACGAWRDLHYYSLTGW